ncbi:hypothetical protein KVR01_011514 [Diaporthe batatas]|uniref:uncharacterized protein n=1 Tax=Diaporthe batatas TaxID=748121 RepID=UPI001D03DACA|nr:uncharacterized protein KVR01_011514 [Diaporthe batatas]KAG8158392.1 hypothetical protein KVR01_011514 [Diaporthe batatas]
MALHNLFHDAQTGHIDTPRLALSLLAALTSYAILLALYRITLHPLAHIPGPKLAAATGWVEAYYELLHRDKTRGRGGQFPFAYRAWHEAYGPIVRISPHEVHIRDASFHEALYAGARPASRPRHLEDRFNNPTSVFATADHHVHRARRAALNPFFSRRRVAERAGLLQERADALCRRVEAEFRGREEKVLVVNDMWGCWALDIIMEYVFGRRRDFVREPGFRAEIVVAIFSMLDGIHWVTQFRWLFGVLYRLPGPVVGWMSSDMRRVIAFDDEMTAQVKEVLNGAESKEQPETIFTSIIQSDIPREEVTVQRLQHEAIGLVGAGVETTMRSLSLSVFHIADNPAVHRRLRAELEAAIPDPDEMPSLNELEKLPFLTACIHESLRLSYGLSQRSPRIFEHEDTVYKNHIIPRGSTISMDTYDVAHDEALFPDSFSYRPDRWLGTESSQQALAPDGRQLSRYLVTFGRGARACVGMQLAWAELYVGLASFLRRFEVEVCGTGREDVELAMDRFVPRPVAGSKGVRVFVK